MMTLIQDLKFGAGLLIRDRTYTVVALLTLALAIGANTAIFSVLHSVLLKPLPYAESENLVMLYNRYPKLGFEKSSNCVPDYLDRKEQTTVFEEVALIAYGSSNIGAEGAPDRVRSMRVTPSFFPLLRAQPVQGRAFDEEDARLSNDKVAILSYALWQRMYGGEPTLVGREIRIDGAPHPIVGIMPKGFDFLNGGNDLLLPFAFSQQDMSYEARHSNFATMIGRLKRGATLEQARAEIDLINERNNERFPEFREILENAGFSTAVVDLQDEVVESVRPTLYLLQAGVALVLIIGCVNVANLLLIRSNGRMKELAVRSALGAGRWRLTRQLLTESVFLACFGGLLGVLTGLGGVRLLFALQVDRIPRGAEIQMDGRVLVFTLIVTVTAGLLFGVIPLVQVLRRNLNEVFHQGGRTGTADRKAYWTRAALVVSQVSITFVLLICAGLMILSLEHVLSENPGFDLHQLHTARLTLSDSRYQEDAQTRSFISQALHNIRSLPGVEAAGITTLLPLTGNDSASAITIEGYTPDPGEGPPLPYWSIVDTGYFSTMGIPLIQGRTFEETDGVDSGGVVVIDRRLASRYWPNENPIGRRIFRGVEDVEEDDGTRWFRIVGVAGNVRSQDLAEQDRVGTVYYYYEQRPPRNMHLVVRATRGGETFLLQAVQKQILRLDPELPLFDIKTMETRLSNSLVHRKTPMLLLLLFAGIALLLSSIGIYGVLAYAVSQRTREIGIRMALGANPNHVLARVLKQGLVMTAIALTIGAAGAFALTRFMTSILYEVTPTDPGVFALVSLILTAVAFLACLAPSLKATRIDPTLALRIE